MLCYRAPIRELNVQNEKQRKPYAVEPFEAGCKAAIFAMLIMGVFLILAGLSVSGFTTQEDEDKATARR